MLIRTRNLTKILPLGCHVRPPFAALYSVFPQPYRYRPNPETSDDTVLDVLSLLRSPKWEQNSILKSIVSHISPHVASQVISRHGGDTDLCLRFFKWVCKHSSYCYDLGQKTQLLKLIVSSSLYGVAHKVIVVLIKECSSGENDILELMRCLDELRDGGFQLNYPCYSSLLMSLAKLDLGFLAYMTYRRMEADGFVVGRIDYRTIVNALCKNGFVEAAEMFSCRLLKLGFELDTHICTSLLLAFCRVLNLGDALRVFDVMSRDASCGPNSVTYSILIHGLCEKDRLEEAFRLKDQMREKGCQPSTRTYTVLIKALCDKGLIEKALNLLDEMVAGGCKPNAHTYTDLIDGLCKLGKIEEANGLYSKMVKEGIFPSVVTYNALINGYCKDGRIIPAIELLGMMEKRNCKPNLRTYNGLLEGLCRVGKSYKAMLLLKRMVDNGLSPDIVSFNILIDGLCREGHIPLAHKLFTSMDTFKLEADCLTFTSIIDAFCKGGKPEVASAFLGLMLKKGIHPDEVTFTTLIDGFCKVGKTKDALFLLETLIKTTFMETPHSLNVVLDVLRKACKVKEEFAMLGKMIKFGLGPSVVSYTILIDGLIRSGDISGALRMLELMKLAGCSPNVYSYTVIISGLCQFGRDEEAEKILHAMPEYGVLPNHVTYTVMVKAYANAGRLDHALETASTMVQRGYQLNDRVYSALLKGFVLSQKQTIECSNENAMDSNSDNVLEEINLGSMYELQAKIEELGCSTSGLCNFMVAQLCTQGRADESIELIQTLLKRGIFPDKAVDTVIESYCRSKNYTDCLKLMTDVLKTGFTPSFRSFSSVIQGLQKEGEVESARELVTELVSSNETLPYVEFLIKGDGAGDCGEVMEVVDRFANRRGKPIF
ncbi:PREDICTED: pentatricopeptide repeat-containing protein At3g07290, mitochondrial isoform X2 [Tarenaya hassleriana]|uniref:pentatricopeptide repeat-containing protein At3g07290, mitochondrial isoform X1 n=1 Tax=Tarenaya hassleriana TaxID=28532 RepID=UPI00053C483A|nr:PREDICTED: pentatricopeptide repeat-containing protein At3g07290, mitochondrial isoform X1 [Tarenaya hassleriana]XP_010524659.1 PREDICTED: pentatricopeptide repeat-containing protein At3g07290, mitochondrial isoform X2 [Tarenaya hassleriana]